MPPSLLFPVTLRAGRPSTRRVGFDLSHGALLVLGLAVWTVGIRRLPLGRMTDEGLPSVMPPAAWLGVALVAASFLLALGGRRRRAVIASILATIVVLPCLAVFAESTTRFVVTWRHVGVADHIKNDGSVNPHIDAYFNWPGFFILTAFLWKATGLSSIIGVVKWAPLVFNLMYLAPLAVIGRNLVGGRVAVWLGIWLFYVSDWIGQDYFSPQGLYFFVYLAIIAAAVHWLRDDRPPPAAFRWAMARLRRPEASPLPPAATAGSAGRVAVVGCCVAMVAAMVPSHQLTPMALALALGALALTGTTSLRLLPLGVLLAALVWMAYIAVPFLIGHANALESGIGSLKNIVGANVGARLRGSPGHTFVVHLRLLMTGVLWALAGAGFVQRVARRQPVAGLAGMAIAAFPLLALQSYGGEALLRVGLFSMPFMSFLAASFLVDNGGETITRWRWALLIPVAALCVATFPYTRYGNERMDYYSPAEISAVGWLYRTAPLGSMIVAASDALPWRYRDYTDYNYRLLTGLDRSTFARTFAPRNNQVSIDLGTPNTSLLLRQVEVRMRHWVHQRSYLIITPTERADLEMMSPWRPDAVPRLERLLRRSPDFRVVYDRGGTTIYRLLTRGSRR